MYSDEERVRPRACSMPIDSALSTRRDRLRVESETPAYSAMRAFDAVTPRPVRVSANRACALAQAISVSTRRCSLASAARPASVAVTWCRSWCSHSTRPDQTGTRDCSEGSTGRAHDAPRWPLSALNVSSRSMRSLATRTVSAHSASTSFGVKWVGISAAASVCDAPKATLLITVVPGSGCELP